VPALGGCSASNVIDLYAADYRQTAATAGDSQLLLNILRAKDDLPIHFSDLSVIHGSIQWTAGASASIPVAQNGSMTPAAISPAVGLQNAPTFDLGTLDTQDFTRGMLSPVDPKIIKQLFDQGVDARLIMLLFFSDFRDLNGHLFVNTLACDPLNPGQHPELGCYNQVYDYLKAIDHLFDAKGIVAGERRRQLQANIYVALRRVGGRLPGDWNLKDNFGDLSKLDATKYRFIDRQIYLISEQRLAICYQDRNHLLSPLFNISADKRASRDACNKGEVKVGEEQKTIAGFTIRSTYEILQYLGQVLRFQEEKGSNRCITLGADRSDLTQRHCDTGEVLFQVNAPVGRPVVGTRYDGGWYALYDRGCNKNAEEHCDYSLQVLAIAELLLNYNKAAKDIVAIPRVQVVP
jgi:hypothetical protein